MKRIAISVFLILVVLLSVEANAVSTDTEHDVDLREILWGKHSVRDDTDELVVLQWAAYFAVDCIAATNSATSDETGLDILRKYGVEGVPQQVSVFHYTNNQFENQHHERYTHLGWDHIYGSGSLDSLGNISHCPDIRKPLLINTVRQVFIYGRKDLWGTIDVTGWFHQPRTNMSEQQIESLAALIYYAHVLGDHCYNTYSTRLDRIPLARRTENDSNPSLIFDLEKHLLVLYSDQQMSSDYRSLIAKMDSIHDDVLTLLGDNDYPSNEQFFSYKQYANELMEELKRRIPRLMEDSSFFPTVFIEPAA